MAWTIEETKRQYDGTCARLAEAELRLELATREESEANEEVKRLRDTAYKLRMELVEKKAGR